MKSWKQTITQGNAAFNDHHMHIALHIYLEALSIAEQDLFRPDACDNEVMALIVSHFNLCDLYMHLLQPSQARQHLQLLQEKLIFAQSLHNTTDLFQLSLTRGIFKCQQQIIQFDQQQESQTQIDSRTSAPTQPIHHTIH